jgi:hypothetical protein
MDGRGSTRRCSVVRAGCSARRASVSLHRCELVYEAVDTGCWMSKQRFAALFSSALESVSGRVRPVGSSGWIARAVGVPDLSREDDVVVSWGRFEVVVHLPRRVRLMPELKRLQIRSTGWSVRVVAAAPPAMSWKQWLRVQLFSWRHSEAAPYLWFGAGFEQLGVDVQRIVSADGTANCP